MNQRRRGGAATGEQSASSIDHFQYSNQHRDHFYSNASSGTSGAPTLQPILYDAPPLNSQSYYQSISRSTPVQRPRPETALPFTLPELRHRISAAPAPPAAPISHRHSFIEGSSKALLGEHRFYSVEEHHDSLSLPLNSDGIPRKTHPGASEGSAATVRLPSKTELREVDDLLASHSAPSHSRFFPTQHQDYSGYSDSQPQSSSALVNLLRTHPINSSRHFPSNEQRIEQNNFPKPQVYRTSEREVERYTYRPDSVVAESLSASSKQQQPIHYPIVELSVPKAAEQRAEPLPTAAAVVSSAPIPYIEEGSAENWFRPATSKRPHVHNSALSPYHSTAAPTRNAFYSANENSHIGESASYSLREQNQPREAHHWNFGPSLLNNSKEPQQVHQSIFRDFEGHSVPFDSTHQRDSAPGDHIDISSLDALLNGDLSEDDMSRSTKEWRSSFSSVRNRFGNRHPEMPNSHDASPGFHFSTNGSLTIPRRLLSKSASQGSVTPMRRAESPSFGRNSSILSNAVERRAAEAPELRRPTARHELGNFWAETVRNRSSSPSVPRTMNYMTAAQRLEMLHEPIDSNGDKRGSRPGPGENLAARRAQFLREAIRANASPNTERAPSGRSTPMPNGFLNSIPMRKEMNSDGLKNDLEMTNGIKENGNGAPPNFTALDNAVAELSDGNSTFDSSRSGGCLRFPTDDLGTLSPTLRKGGVTGNWAHSPSPDAVSDASSNYNAPSGLPHPKPKHNIREQLIQAGFEPRGNSYVSRFGARFTSSPNFPVPSTGSVASRISDFEKRPGAPNLLQIACALNGIPHKNDAIGGIRSPVGPMSPRSSVYRTKPVIHADLGLMSPKPHAETNGGPPSVFEFPPSKHHFADAKDEIPYYGRDSVAIKNDTPTTRSSSNLDKIGADSVSLPRIDNLKLGGRGGEHQSGASSSPTLAERRFERKNAAAHGRNDATVPSSPSSSYTPSLLRIRPVDVPRFYFPKGKPVSMLDNEAALRRVSDVFSRIGGKAEMIDMAEICKAAGIPVYWKRAVYDSCCGLQPRPISLADFSAWWNRMTSVAHDEASRFIYAIAGPHRNYILKDDLAPILQDLIESFPGLHFLREAQEFHARYVETVTVRIFWSVNRSWTGRITANELRHSNFLETIRKLETTDDINTITDYFSYEHFYVIYCKFYEIDKDHNLVINKIDMAQHANGALPGRIIDRIFSGAVTRAPGGKRIREAVETITYTDFVAFLLAEEDKKHPTSIEYWFRCLDMDGDGLLSLYEMEYFYNGVKGKMDQHNIDSMRFDDVVCNLLDLIRPRQPNVITLSDLKRCSLCTRFFNTFVNWVKYYEQESSEGERATVLQTDGEEELNDWDRYCLEEYEALMADDQENDEPEDINLNLDDDDDLGTNVSLSVSMPLRDFTDTRRSPVLEAL